MTQEWTSISLPALLSEFEPEDIYNADETGLFYKCLPEKTFAMKGDTCKEQLTVLVAANMTGSDKLPLLAIGKFAKSRSFEGIQTLPVQYEANQKALMKSDIFTSWLIKLDQNFLSAGWKVAMVIDNCPAHPNVQAQLQAIKLVFFAS